MKIQLMAGIEDESGIETIRTKIPSIRLTTSLLEDLVEIIDKEYKDIKKQNESASVTYANSGSKLPFHYYLT